MQTMRLFNAFLVVCNDSVSRFVGRSVGRSETDCSVHATYGDWPCSLCICYLSPLNCTIAFQLTSLAFAILTTWLQMDGQTNRDRPKDGWINGWTLNKHIPFHTDRRTEGYALLKKCKSRQLSYSSFNLLSLLGATLKG